MRPPAGGRRNLSNRTGAQVRGGSADTPRMNPVSANPSLVLPSAMDSGLATVAGGNTRLNQDAAQIANPANGIPIAPLADLTQASLTAEAGAAVIRASNEMLGTLLDAFA